MFTKHAHRGIKPCDIVISPSQCHHMLLESASSLCSQDTLMGELYFVTFQVVGWLDVFSRQIYRDIFLESLDYSQKHKGLEVYAYVIMTNHVHLILGSATSKLSDTIRDVKRFTSNKILKAISESHQESR